MSGALLPGWLEQIYVMTEVWAGILICLSVCAYGLRRPAWGVVFGLSSIAVRELAAPYCVICLALAVYDRRWRETAAWIIGLTAYLVFYAWHAHYVMSLVQPGDHAHEGSWLQFGGAPFVIAVTQMNGYLLLLPQWVSALYLPLALLGFAGWNSATGLRAGPHRLCLRRAIRLRRPFLQSILGFADRPPTDARRRPSTSRQSQT